MPHHDILVLGAGAAGLMAAFTAGRRGRRVLVLDHADRIGKKILISGGGRCNFTNLHTRPENFLSANPHFAKSALARYTPADFLALVDHHAVPWHEKTLGQLFCDRHAHDIVTLLERECAQANVRIQTSTRILEVTRSATPGPVRFHVRTSQGDHTADALIVATGGLSIPKMGATAFGYDLARQFGHTLIDPRPALVPFTLSPHDLAHWADLSGLSTEVIASLPAAQPQTQGLHNNPLPPNEESTSRPQAEGRSGETPAFRSYPPTKSSSQPQAACLRNNPLTPNEESSSQPQSPGLRNHPLLREESSSRPEAAGRSGETPAFRSYPATKSSSQPQSPGLRNNPLTREKSSSRPQAAGRSGETPAFRSYPATKSPSQPQSAGLRNNPLPREESSSRPEAAGRSGETPAFRSYPGTKSPPTPATGLAPRPTPAFREKMLLTHRGLSGPAILQISTYWTPGQTLHLDLAPGHHLTAPLLAPNARRDPAAAAALLRALLPVRLADRWLALNPPSAWTNAGLAALERTLHAWPLTPAGTEGYLKAEVTAGGVNTSELDARTLESRITPGLFFIGEVVDVTGWLGGYNFQWAWASATAAGLTA